jgi:hypothetical protein
LEELHGEYQLRSRQYLSLLIDHQREGKHLLDRSRRQVAEKLRRIADKLGSINGVKELTSHELWHEMSLQMTSQDQYDLVPVKLR